MWPQLARKAGGLGPMLVKIGRLRPELAGCLESQSGSSGALLTGARGRGPNQESESVSNNAGRRLGGLVEQAGWLNKVASGGIDSSGAAESDCFGRNVRACRLSSWRPL